VAAVGHIHMQMAYKKVKKKEKEVRHTRILKQFLGPNEGNKKSNLI